MGWGHPAGIARSCPGSSSTSRNRKDESQTELRVSNPSSVVNPHTSTFGPTVDSETSNQMMAAQARPLSFRTTFPQSGYWPSPQLDSTTNLLSSAPSIESYRDAFSPTIRDGSPTFGTCFSTNAQMPSILQPHGPIAAPAPPLPQSVGLPTHFRVIPEQSDGSLERQGVGSGRIDAHAKQHKTRATATPRRRSSRT